jgi:hypothetical protein
VLALVVLSAAGCRRTNTPETPGPAAATETAVRDGVDGIWVHREVPSGFEETLTLRTHGYDVHGQGTFRLGGGREGVSRVTGSWRRRLLTLYIVRSDGVRERWTGHLTRGRLQGEISVETPPEHRGFNFDRPGAAPRLP